MQRATVCSAPVAICVLAVSAAMSGQAPSPAPVVNGWRRFGENERLVAYHQDARHGKNDTVTVWVLYDYKTEQQSARSGRRYFSQKGQQEVDCRGDKTRTIFFSWHAGRMGEGAVVYTGLKALPWESTSPGSIARALSAAVCPTVFESVPHLTRVASEVNKTLPMMIDRDTELSTVGMMPETIVYNYRLVNIVASDPASQRLVDRLRPAAVKQACTNPQTSGGLLNRGITMRFSYRDRDGVFIGAFNVASVDCSKTGARR